MFVFFQNKPGQVTMNKKISAMWPSLKLNQDFMAILVTICKFHKDLIETKWALPGTRSNLGFFSTQGKSNSQVC